MSIAHLTLDSTPSGDDVDACLTFLNATKCDVTTVGRPNRIEVNGFLLREPKWLLRTNELYIDAEAEPTSSVPCEG